MNSDERITVLEGQMEMVKTNLDLAKTLMERLIRNTERETEALNDIQKDVKDLLAQITVEEE